MSNSNVAPGVVGAFAGLDVPSLLKMRAETRRYHPFLIWAPFDAPARKWAYGEFYDRVGALAAGLEARGNAPGADVPLHLGNCLEGIAALLACVQRIAIGVRTPNTSAPPEPGVFARPHGPV